MTTAYVLIDFENVQPKELGAFGGGGFKVKVFVGASQASVPVGLANAMQALGHAGSYVLIDGSGRNALDMHIAYYIGRLAVEDPGADFHIISRDRDYDPLIRHLKTQGIDCTRYTSVAEITKAHAPVAAARPARAQTPKVKPAAKAAAPKAVKASPKAAAKPAPKPAKAVANVSTERVDGVIRNLEKRARARPATTKALASTIKSLYRGIDDKEVSLIVEELKLRGVIAVDGEKVTYQLS